MVRLEAILLLWFVITAYTSPPPKEYRVSVDGKQGEDTTDCTRGRTSCKTLAFALAYIPYNCEARISIAKGVYTGQANVNLVISSNVQLSGNFEVPDVIFDCQHQGYGFVMSPNIQVVLLGIHIRNCRSTYGGAVLAGRGSELTVYFCGFVNNYASQRGGAIYLEGQGGELMIAESQFVGNEAGKDGGAVALKSAHYLIATFSDFMQNRAATGSGGAIHLENTGGAILYTVDMENNIAQTYGGAVAAHSVDIFTIDNNKFPSAMYNNCVVEDYYDSYTAQFQCDNCKVTKITNTTGCLEVKPKKFYLSQLSLLLIVVGLPFSILFLVCVAWCVYAHTYNQAHMETAYSKLCACGWSVL